MNITLSADKRLIEKSRDYAKKHNTTLNNLIREYLKRIVNEREMEQISLEFENLAKSHAGESPADYHFNRDEIYSRGV
jgi:hypothetical protein